jgi:hypothetical protein
MNETIAPEITEVAAPTVFEIPAYRLEEFNKIVARANARLAKAGAAESFQFTSKEFSKQINRQGQAAIYAPYFRLTLVNDSFRIAAGNHTFVASLVAEEAGYTVHTAPGQNLEGWTRPDVNDIHCDHCNTVRNRHNIYIVRNNETGALLQLGSNCIAPFLGFSPQSLWALTFTGELAGLQGETEDGGGWRARAAQTVEIDLVLGLAWAYTNQGRSYVSTKAAFDGRIATVSKVSGHIFNGYPRRINFGKDEAAYQRAVAEYTQAETVAAEFRANTELVTAVKDAVTEIKAGSDYRDNLEVILAAPSGRVTSRNIGILASLASAYARQQQIAEERKATPLVKGYLGEIKERLRNLKITLTTVKEIETGYGYATLLVGRTEDGHAVKWFASGTLSVEVGDTIVLDATIKALETYEETDQTVVTRGKIK